MHVNSSAAAFAFDRLHAVANGRIIEPLGMYDELDDKPCPILVSRGGNAVPPSVAAHRGSGNMIFIGYEADAARMRLKIYGSDNVVFIGPHCRVGGDIEIGGNNNLIYIGAFTTISSITHNQAGHGGQFFIGDHCMISSRIQVGNTDGHSIFDLETGLRINPNKDVRIDDRVWIARDVSIGKGVTINHDVVVGQKAHVVGTLEANSIYAGVPAKLIRSGITWSRSSEASIPEWHDSDHQKKIDGKKEKIINRINVFNSELRASLDMS